MYKKKVRIFTIVSIIILCICYTVKSFNSNNDLFYMIKLGEDIFKYGIDLIDHHSFINGLSYTYPHWLYSVYTYLIYSKMGFQGIYIFTIISYIVLMLSIYYINLKMNKNEYLSSIVTLIITPLVVQFICARAQVFSMTLMIWEVYFINKLIETGKKKYIVYLSIISLLIANIHGSAWIMCLILFLPFIGEHIVYLIFRKKEKKLNENKIVSIKPVENIRLVFIAFLLASIMGIFTPSRICYTYSFRAALGPSLDYIMEHQKLIPLENIMFLILIVILFLIRKKIILRDMFMVLGLTILSLMSVRHLFFYYTIGIIYISKLANEYLEENKDYTINILGNKIFSKLYLIAIMITLILISGVPRLKINLNAKYITNSKYPIKAVQYIKENLDYKNIRMYNEYNVGSYILYNDVKVFIDSRCELYLKEFTNGKVEIFNDNTKIIDNPINYKKIFKKYNLEYALIKRKTNLYYLMEEDDNFEKIYSDKSFVIYKEKTG